MKLNNADKIYAGSTEVDNVYSGSNLVWQNIVVPGAPFIDSLSVASASQINVNFSQGSDGGGTISDYEYQLNGGSWVSSSQTSSPISITGLSNGTTYNIRIRAINEAGASNESNQESATTWSVPSAPTLSSVTNPTTNSLRLNFSAPSSNGGTAITNYQYRIGSGSWVNMNTTSSPFTVSGLSAYTTYSFTIRAVNAVGVSSASNSVSGTTKIWATGGSVTTSGGYRIHTFTSSGTLTFSGGGGNVEYLVVAGGGGGGGGITSGIGGGGGGAGGMRTGTRVLSSGGNTVVVGAGGSGSGAVSGAKGGNGSASSIPGLSSIGGGGGGQADPGWLTGGGNSGGSGGGAGGMGFWWWSTGGGGSSGQGSNGGSSGGNGVANTNRENGAGGGGRGGNGGQSSDFHNGSPGGAGSNSAITGTNTTYAWGGRGGGNIGAGPHGTNGRGAGGGGAYGAGSHNGGNGGSGIVVVRYPL